ncbi:MAG TPA: alpha-(1-_3)-arabinofuranosyltransferase family protein [Acidimicrobiales bacterium]|nr:alpha-(1->3)-arabinofuranosyltransferase family protein [Acidimicrobiales bacterium]
MAWVEHLVLAGVSYVPLLRTAPGVVGADTKQYLYIHPASFMAQVASMWDPDVAMGTVTHQYIGYLLPMGPYYALMQALGVPMWVAQRLWTGSLLFLAGAGVLFLMRTLSRRARPAPGPAPAAAGATVPLGLARVGWLVAALAYMLSPYVLQNEARASVLLLPWVALPWMLGLVARALWAGGWRHAALFALVVALAGSTNATALLLVGVAPALWVVWELVGGRVPWRRAVGTAVKIGVLSVAVSLWWAVGLAVEGAYGVNVLHYTESVATVARTSTPTETLRGLGYWFFYGVDKLGLYLPMAGPYMTSLWLLAVSLAVPATAFVAAFVFRWRERAFFVALVVAGTAMAVGAQPLSHPSPLGALVKAGATDSTVGLALRSTNRATPLVVLGLAVLLGGAVCALLRRWKVAGLLSALAVAGLVAADLPALWTGQFVAADNARPESIPSYWSAAAAYLDHQPGAAQTRVLTEPGIDFAAYRWGVTLDPVLPGLLSRPEVERNLVPYGSPGSANLLDALDEEVQEGTLPPDALAPMARLMSAGDVVLQSDLQYELYDTPRPQVMWSLLDPPPPGLTAPVGFGDPAVTAQAPQKYPLVDETELGLPAGASYPPPVAVFGVPGARPIVRAEGAGQPMIVDGDGSGLLDAAAAGLLDGQATVLYSGSYAADPAGLARALAQGGDLVVTDTNRRQAEQYGTVRENTGYTESPGEKPPVPDPLDHRTNLFGPSAGDDTKTVSLQLGVKSIEATGYGNPITYAPESRPDQAMDGDLRTSWTVGAFADPVGQYLRITLEHPVTTGTVNLVQPLYGSRNRWVTKATLRFDGGHPMVVHLGAASRTAAGQSVSFPTRTFTTLQITVDATNTGTRSSYDGQSGVGFAEVGIAGQRVDEVVRLPEDLLQAAGASSASHRLTLVMDRQRTAPVPPRTDPEVDMARLFTLPTARSFSVSGTAEISPLVPDDVIDRLLGTTVPGVVAAYSSGRLPGDIDDRASSTLDGSAATLWSPGLGPQAGNWLQYDLARPITFGQLSMDVVADGRHSVPTEVTVSAGGQRRTVALPPVTDSPTPGATTPVSVSFPPLTGAQVRVTFDAVEPRRDLDYYSNVPIELPLGIAELSVPGMPHARLAPATLPGVCRSDLLSVDGAPVPVAVTGPVPSARSTGALAVRGCGAAAGGITLSAGSHLLQTQPGSTPGVGVDVDSLVLDSAPGGAALAPQADGLAPPADSSPAPRTTVLHASSTSATVVVHDPTGPFWMVLGESTNAGWHASVAGHDLGAPQLIDGYGNGWLVTPSAPGHDLVITLQWTPQHLVDAALVFSALSLVLCAALALAPTRRRRSRRAVADHPAQVPAGPPGTALFVEGGAPGADGGPPPFAAWRGAPPTAEVPTLWWPWRSAGRRPRGPALVLASAAAGAVAAVAVTPAAAVPVAAACALALASSYGRAVLLAGAVGLSVVVDDMVSAAQGAHRYPSEFGWPTHFSVANTLTWLAVVTLGTDALVDTVRTRSRRPARAAAAPVRRRAARGLLGRGRRAPRGKHVRRS